MSSKDAVVRLYRTFMRFGNNLTQQKRTLEFKEPLRHPWGHSAFTSSGPDYRLQAFRKALPQAAPPADDACFSGQQLKSYVRRSFKGGKAAEKPQISELLDLAFKGLRVLHEQNYMDRCSSSQSTDGILIQATSQFNEKAEGFDGKDQYVFTYRVRITNNREDVVQMLGREWLFQDADGAEAHSTPLNPQNALVGQQPRIPPGRTWEYYSGCPLPTPAGTGRGKLVGAGLGPGPEMTVMKWITPIIPPFPLLTPDSMSS